ncbi:hypothetical protein T02_15220 [Trichinella nativa]|uniref:Uncharacterized protein n=1 Tax=Trichinella nativa TaxID=6335 RepID=A0A0V1LF12_9BILA|nr:hypothetical protein T02_15220 [Trichinella nativa]
MNTASSEERNSFSTCLPVYSGLVKLNTDQPTYRPTDRPTGGQIPRLTELATCRSANRLIDQRRPSSTIYWQPAMLSLPPQHPLAPPP